MRKIINTFKSRILLGAFLGITCNGGLWSQESTGGDSDLNPGEHLELRGHYRLGGKWKFNIFHKKNNSSKWLKVGQKTGDFTLRSYDESSKSLLIERDGSRGYLQLSKSKGGGPVGGGGPPAAGGKGISSTNLRFKNGLYYELGKDKTPFSGKATKKYPDGKPWYERNYSNGKKHGPTMEWFPNGQKKYVMYYSNNARTGVWTYWNDKGNVTAKRQYENNNFVKNLPLN